MTPPTSPTPTPPPSELLTVRTPLDALALVPVVLGFVPAESIVMLTFGAERPLHARCDLPDADLALSEVDTLAQVVDALVTPALVHGVRQVLLLVYTEDARLAREAAWAAYGAFEFAGLAVLDVLHVGVNRWCPALGERAGVPVEGVPYDISAHPFLAQAVLTGRVVLGSRDDLRATLAADPGRTGGVVAALAGLTGDPPADGTSQEWRAEEAAWVAELVSRHVRAGSVPDDDEVARLLRGLLDTTVRDAAWAPLTRACAPQHVDFWTGVVRRAPVPLLAAPATLLALAAWQSGHGALAWCALDRCAEADEAYPLAAVLARVLEEAVEPEAWDGTTP